MPSRNKLFGKSRLTMVVAAAFAVLLLGPLTYPTLRSESRFWRLAVLQNRFSAGDVGAIDDVLAELNGSKVLDLSTVRLAVAMLLESGRSAEAVRCCRRAIDQQGNSDSSKSNPLSPLLLNAQLDDGEYDEALQTFQTILDTKKALAPQQTFEPDDVNGLAYQRTLAGVELDQAQTDIEEAIDAVERADVFGTRIPLHLVAILGAAMLADDEHPTDILLSELASEIESRKPSATAPEFVSSKSLANHRKDQLKLLYTVRAFLLERLGRFDESTSDRAAVNAVGGNADQILRQIHSNKTLFEFVERAGMYLDTRAYIQYRLNTSSLSWADRTLTNLLLGRAPSAGASSLKDFDAAVIAAQACYEHLADFPGSNLDPSLFVDAHSYSLALQALRKQLATIVLHRLWAERQAGDETSAKEDHRRLKDLGFSESDNLH